MESKEYVIIGAGLTGLTLAFYLRKAGREVMVLEKEPKSGGVIATLREEGFIVESGPNTGVLSSPEIVELFEDLAGKCALETARPESKRRLILKKGAWHALPSGLVSGFLTPLFTWKDKFRILGEPFRKPGSDPMESVAGLVRRRLGDSFLEYAVDPFVSGIYAGDPGTLVTRFALPKLYRLEQDYGSFIRGALKKQGVPKTEREKKVTKEVFSVKGGLGFLTEALTDSLGEEALLTGCSGIRVFPSSRGFRLSFRSFSGEERTVHAAHVISTTGAYALPELFPFLPQEMLDPVTSLRYARVVQAAVGYRHWEGFDLQAFGGLIPSSEHRKILGILFPSSLFEGRAPSGGALLSVFCGGTRHPEYFGKSDEWLRAMILETLRETLQVSRDPDLFRIFRYPHAIAQYEASTGQRWEQLSRIEAAFPGLWLAGNLRDGIGMADRVSQARKLADYLIGSSE